MEIGTKVTKRILFFIASPTVCQKRPQLTVFERFWMQVNSLKKICWPLSLRKPSKRGREPRQMSFKVLNRKKECLYAIAKLYYEILHFPFYFIQPVHLLHIFSPSLYLSCVFLKVSIFHLLYFSYLLTFVFFSYIAFTGNGGAED